jgi:four helix bundle protein
MQSNKPKFRDMIEKRVYNFALDIIKFVDQLPKGQVSHVIGEQLLRSATSIGANVVEAQGAASRKDYANFFSHALKSANETKFWLSLLQDSGKADKASVEKLLKETVELAKILATSILSLKGRG